MVQFINNSLGFLTLIGHPLIITCLIIFFTKQPLPIYQFLKKNGLLFAFFFAFIATAGSLFYSDVAGYEPCKFCWFQRIFMYPLSLLFLIALIKKDKNINLYGFWMAGIGGLIALNHYILQITGTSILPCSAVGYSVSCSKVFVLKFGYITIPVMALTAFILIIISLMYARKESTQSIDQSL